LLNEQKILESIDFCRVRGLFTICLIFVDKNWITVGEFGVYFNLPLLEFHVGERQTGQFEGVHLCTLNDTSRRLRATELALV